VVEQALLAVAARLAAAQRQAVAAREEGAALLAAERGPRVPRSEVAA
jgi:hypothetical protein